MKQEKYISDAESSNQVEQMGNFLKEDQASIEKVESVDVQAAWKKQLVNKRKNVFRRYLQKTLPYAAIITLVLISGYYMGRYSNAEHAKEAFTVFNIPSAEMGQLTLPDGTEVAINSATEVKYSTGFLKSRHVYLKGEAFFEVTSNPKNPFFVHVDDFIVKVTGTKFNVKSYEGKNPEATLEEGKITVLSPEGKSVVDLKPNESVTFKKDEKRFLVTTVDPRVKAGWKDGKIFMKNQTIEEMAEILERWYNVQIVFDQASIKDVRLTGTILKDKPIEQLLTVLVRSEPIEFKIENENSQRQIITLRYKEGNQQLR